MDNKCSRTSAEQNREEKVGEERKLRNFVTPTFSLHCYGDHINEEGMSGLGVNGCIILK